MLRDAAQAIGLDFRSKSAENKVLRRIWQDHERSYRLAASWMAEPEFKDWLANEYGRTLPWTISGN